VIALTADGDGTVLPVKVQPGARKNAVLGAHAGALRVAVTAPPERGKANEAVAKLLAEAFGCKASQVELVAGATARQKRFLVRGLAPAALGPVLERLLAGKAL
jgi:uncharacterized protein (TIGR00251 family)